MNIFSVILFSIHPLSDEIYKQKETNSNGQYCRKKDVQSQNLNVVNSIGLDQIVYINIQFQMQNLMRYFNFMVRY